MNQNQEEREYVEAVPGPAIVISKKEYERMQKHAKQNTEENQRRLEKIRQQIKNGTIKIDDSEISDGNEFTI